VQKKWPLRRAAKFREETPRKGGGFAIKDRDTALQQYEEVATCLQETKYNYSRQNAAEKLEKSVTFARFFLICCLLQQSCSAASLSIVNAADSSHRRTCATKDSREAAIPQRSKGWRHPMADVVWFENVLGSFNPTRASTPPAIAIDTARFGRHRTIFVSDTHLGTRGCKAEALADFLAHNECDTLFLVGDIVDGWQLKRRWYWTDAQSQVVMQILRKVDAGTRVVFVPGNHDEFARDYAGRLFAGVEIINEAVHETADGKRLWVLHGDRFDGVIAYAKWLAHVGDWAYGMALRLNDMLFSVRKQLGMPYWSLSAFLKHKVKNAVEYISRFEEIVAREAEMRGVDGVVCGHIHHAEIRQIGGVLYLNDGDWVESCSALVEDAQGNMEILRWADPQQRHATRHAGEVAAVASGTPAAAPVPA
jgi:UDP-2,3-diacylglucosamine pyrophosphatase LpxH